MCDSIKERNNVMNADKQALRKHLREIRKGIADKPTLSGIICDNAARLVRGNVMVYLSIGSEVSTDKLILDLLKRDDVNVFAPYTTDGEICPRRIKAIGKADSRGNLSESLYCDKMPAPPTKIDVCITPLLGFNERRYRIGYGKGCYDRFFAKTDAYKIGLAFSAQQIIFAPEPHDVPLDCCVTEKDVVY